MYREKEPLWTPRIITWLIDIPHNCNIYLLDIIGGLGENVELQRNVMMRERKVAAKMEVGGLVKGGDSHSRLEFVFSTFAVSSLDYIVCYFVRKWNTLLVFVEKVGKGKEEYLYFLDESHRSQRGKIQVNLKNTNRNEDNEDKLTISLILTEFLWHSC